MCEVCNYEQVDSHVHSNSLLIESQSANTGGHAWINIRRTGQENLVCLDLIPATRQAS